MENLIKMDDLGYPYFRKHPDAEVVDFFFGPTEDSNRPNVNKLIAFFSVVVKQGKDVESQQKWWFCS